jgi:hypothetical protein
MTGKIFYAPLTLAGEGKGEGGYNLFPLTAAFPLRDPVILISILKSGSGIPYSLIYAKRSGTVSSPQGERK